jgi:lipoprotein-anchoring transpeptidase ErfK/SrfK
MPGADVVQRFESTWDRGLPAFDRYLWAAAPEDVLLAPVPDDSGEGRRVVYSLEDQMVWLVTEDGSVVANYLVSGRKGWPNPGTYQVFSKSPITRAYLSPTTTMRWMVRFARTANTNIGFHDIPLSGNGTPYQTLDELGTALSGGCVRQSSEDAIRMYRFADIGTTVVVTP